jgi:hypothetical protein
VLTYSDSQESLETGKATPEEGIFPACICS